MCLNVGCKETLPSVRDVRSDHALIHVNLNPKELYSCTFVYGIVRRIVEIEVCLQLYQNMSSVVYVKGGVAEGVMVCTIP